MARILVIEDDDQFQKTLKEMLSWAGYEVLVASNGKIGVELYCKEQPDLVVTDVIMPEKDGRKSSLIFKKSSLILKWLLWPEEDRAMRRII